MKYSKKPSRGAVPPWLFPVVMTVYCELLMHLWITPQLHFGRLAALLLFAAGLGGVLGLLVSLIPSRPWSKLAGVLTGLVLTVLYMTEYFLSDAYSVFMPLSTVFSGAGGVAKDYFNLVMSLLVRSLWRIGLMLLPVLLYALLGQVKPASWKGRGIAAGAVLACYLLGFAGVHTLTPDAARLTTAYSFDSVVRTMGLGMGLTLEAVPRSSDPGFVATPVEPAPPTQPTQPSDPLPDEGQEASVPVTEPPRVYGDQVMEGVDFAALAQTGHANVRSIYQYLAGLTPAKQNEYTGLFEGKNLILITAEAFSAEVIDPELTPTLYRMANEGIKFTDYYQPSWGSSTISGEYSNVMGLVPPTDGNPMGNVIYQDMFLTMGNQLQAQGYFSAAYHNHDFDFYSRNSTHTHLGYDTFTARGSGMEPYITPEWPESDVEMFDFSMPQYLDRQPFSVYYMTVSGHCPYDKPNNAQTRRHFDKVAHLDYSETVLGYLASQQELELSMAALLSALEEKGIADDTVVVISADHYPYGLERSKTWNNYNDHLGELYGVGDYDKFYQYHNALIIWSGCLEDMDLVVEEPVYSLDILPTLSNLFGVEYDSRLLVGRDVFSEQEPLVMLMDYSWLTDKGSFDAQTGVFTPKEGVTVDEGYAKRIGGLVTNKFAYSQSVVRSLFFDRLLEDTGRK